MAVMQDSATLFRSALIHAVAPWGIVFEAEQLASLESHYLAMVNANEAMNLTRITEPVDAAVKHFGDSLAVLCWAGGARAPSAEGGRVEVLDLGTGAGFPAVPVAVMRPGWRVTALDGTRKKAEFVSRVAADLGLKNFSAEHGHSDHWDSRAKFDIVTTRAVASLARCMRTSHRFVKKGGALIAYKTAKLGDDEISEAREACAELGMEMEPPFFYELKLNAEIMERALYAVRRLS